MSAKSILLRCFVLSLPCFVAMGADDVSSSKRVAVVTRMPGCVAFWDFVKREADHAKSFGHIYAMHKSNSGDVSPKVPADSPAELLDASWQCFAMTFDHERDELTGWLNGKNTGHWQENVKNTIPPIYNAWLQGELHREPGTQPGEDAGFPNDQFYNPPEDSPVSVKILSETADERVELREFGYTRVKVTLRKGADGKFSIAARELTDVRLNPWWYPHDIYAPEDATSGGPFTIGRVIHSSRSVGFTGWIGGVAVFDRALNPEEMARLAALRKY